MKYIIFFFGLLFATFSKAQCLDTDDIILNNAQNIKTPPGTTQTIFDWTQRTYKFVLLDMSSGQRSNVEESSPFFWQQQNLSTTHIQAQPNDKKDFESSEGWELVGYNFGSATSGVIVPYLFLYNRFEGILRTFFFIPANLPLNDGYNAGHITLKFNSLNQSTYNESALLNYLQLPAEALDRFEKNIIASSPSRVPSTGHFWMYADFPMAYDPCTCNYFSQISVIPVLMKKEKIEMQQDDITTSGTSGSNAITPVTTQVLADINQFVSKVTGVTKTLTSMGEVFNSLGLTKVVKETKIDFLDDTDDYYLLSSTVKRTPMKFPDELKSLSGKIGLFLGVVEFISSGGKSTPTSSIATKGLKYKITGQSTIPYELTGGDFFVPGSLWAANSGLNLAKPAYNNTLGIFALTETPRIIYKTSLNSIQGPSYTYYSYNGQEMSSNIYNHIVFDFKLLDNIKYRINPASGYKPEPIEVMGSLIFNVDASCLKSPSTGDQFPPFCTFNSPTSSSLKIVRDKKSDGSLSNMVTISTPVMPISCLNDYVAHLAYLGNTPLKAHQPGLFPASTARFFEDVRLQIAATLERQDDPNKKHLFSAQYQLAPERTWEAIPNTPISNIPLNTVVENITLTENKTIMAWETITLKGNINTNGFTLRVIAGSEINTNELTNMPPNIELLIGLPLGCQNSVPISQRPSQLYSFCAKPTTKKYNPTTTSKSNLSEQIKEVSYLKILPNPFKDELRVRFELSETEQVQLFLVNTLGQVVQVALKAEREKGIYEETLSTHDLPTGIYYVTLQTQNGIKTQKVLKTN